jgi:hypothetical protein
MLHRTDASRQTVDMGQSLPIEVCYAPDFGHRGDRTQPASIAMRAPGRRSAIVRSMCRRRAGGEPNAAPAQRKSPGRISRGLVPLKGRKPPPSARQAHTQSAANGNESNVTSIWPSSQIANYSDTAIVGGRAEMPQRRARMKKPRHAAPGLSRSFSRMPSHGVVAAPRREYTTTAAA